MWPETWVGGGRGLLGPGGSSVAIAIREVAGGLYGAQGIGLCSDLRRNCPFQEMPLHSGHRDWSLLCEALRGIAVQQSKYWGRNEYAQCGQRKEGALFVEAWKTWQRKHSGWTLEEFSEQREEAPRVPVEGQS